MNIKIDNQLVQVYMQEALLEAAQARAERNAQPARAKVNSGIVFFALIAAGLPIGIWLIQIFKAG